MSAEIKVFAIEDDQSFTLRLGSLNGAIQSVQVIGSDSDYASAHVALKNAAPDVVALSKRSGLTQFLQILHSSVPFIHTLVLASARDDVETLWRLGVTGICSDNIDAVSLCNALRAVSLGHVWLERDLAARVRGLQHGAAKPNGAIPQVNLSERELSVLRLVANGARNREIAGELYTSISTIKNDIARILAKLGVDDRVEAAVFATRHGLI